MSKKPQLLQIKKKEIMEALLLSVWMLPMGIVMMSIRLVYEPPHTLLDWLVVISYLMVFPLGMFGGSLTKSIKEQKEKQPATRTGTAESGRQ